MPKTTAEKLQIKAKSSVFVSGEGAELLQLLGPLPEGVTITKNPSTADVAMPFITSRADLDAKANAHLEDLSSARAVWIAYPKGGRADINRDGIWRRVEELGWTLIANVSLNDTWSAVRTKREPWDGVQPRV